MIGSGITCSVSHLTLEILEAPGNGEVWQGMRACGHIEDRGGGMGSRIVGGQTGGG